MSNNFGGQRKVAYFLKSRRTLVIGLAALTIFALGYAWYVYRFPAWTEDVQLPDGRRIAVHQRRDVIEGYGTRKTWLRFSLPEMGGEQEWVEWLYPTMIGVADGKVYVIGRPRGDKQFGMHLYPRYTYVAYQWQHDRFVRIPFMSVPEPLRRRENVRWCLPGGDDSREPASESTESWCVVGEPPPSSGEPYFPSLQEVDLDLKMREAEFWAHLTGNRPSSE